MVKEFIEEVSSNRLSLAKKWGARDSEEVSVAITAMAESFRYLTPRKSSGEERSKSELFGYVYTSVQRALWEYRNKEISGPETVSILDGDAEEVVDVNEIDDLLVEIILERMNDQQERNMIILLMMGFTADEIKEVLSITRGKQWRIRKALGVRLGNEFGWNYKWCFASLGQSRAITDWCSGWK
jgi:CRISPR/Cas system-associated endonuclease Cas3-HD